MSDGLDPRHGPYRGKQVPNFDEWRQEFMFSLLKANLLRPRASSDELEREVKGFATAVVKATRDGNFTEVG